MAGIDRDGFLVRAAPGKVFLVGKNDWGTAYACWEVLGKWGVRWFLPGSFGEKVPALASLDLPAGEELHEPWFRHRQFSFNARANFRNVEDARDWLDRNRERARLEYHHNLSSVFPPEKWAERYPDLYPILA